MITMLIRTVASLTVLSILAGCASFTPKPLLPEKTAQEFEARSLSSLTLKQFVEKNLGRQLTPWPPEKWNMGMLTLAAFYYNPSLDNARWKWKEAEAGIIKAGQRPNPSTSLSPEYVTNLSPGTKPWVLGFSFDIPIETAGKRGYRIAEAKGRSDAARFALADAAWKVRSTLRDALLDYFTAVRRDGILGEQVKIQAEMLTLLKERLAVGEVSEPDVTRASVDYDRTLISLREAQSRLIGARAKVAGAIGVPVAALDGIDLSAGLFNTPPSLEGFSLPALRREALTNRPDILEALAQYAASQSKLQLEIAKQYPDVHIGPGYIYDQGENKWGIGITVELPVLNRNQGPIAEAEAARSGAAARFSALQGSIIIDTERAAAEYRSSLDRFQAADRLASEKDKAVGSLKAMFDAGEIDRLALLGGMVEYADVQLERLDSLANANRMLGHLEDALQRPLEPSAALPAVPEKNPREKAP
jgi:cobalt-zinc-cadmium efflux system outer membrane protein